MSFTWCGKKGDLALYMTHVQLQGDHAEHGALYIRNENRKVPGGGSPAFLVPLRDFWMFRPEDKDRGAHHSYMDMQQALANASIALYGLDVPDYRHRIHDAILDFVDDVKNLTPPPAMTKDQWESEIDRYGLKVYANGERIR